MNSLSIKTSLASRRTFLVCLLLAISTLAVYWRTGSFSFTNYDDPYLIYENPIVTAGLTLRGVLWAFSTSYFDFWHPLTWVSHMVDCEFFGLRAGLHHLSSVAFHISSAVLLFATLQRMTGAWKRSAMVAALFALHPLHVESVAWLAERKDVLSGFFFMLTTWAYVRYVELCPPSHEFQTAWPAASGPGPGDSGGEVQPKTIPESETAPPVGSRSRSGDSARNWYRVALLAFALGLMSKAMIVTLPFVLLLLDCWPLRRFTLSPLDTSNLLPLLREKFPFFALAIGSGLVTYASMNSRQNVLSGATISWGFRLENVFVSCARYLGKSIWPAHLAAMYPMPSGWTLGQVGGSVVLLLLVTAVALSKLLRAPSLTVGWLIFLGMLVPVIGVVAMSYAAIADRYTYLPSIGLFIAAVWAGADLFRRFRIPSGFGAALAVLVLGTCGYFSWVQTGYWRDSITLWRHCLAVTPNNVVAHYNLGWALQHVGQPQPALAEYRAALDIQPEHLDANMNMGVSYFMLGQMQQATNWFAKAIQLKPDYAKAQENMGNTLVELGDFAGAMNYLNTAIKLDPSSPGAHTGLGRALSAQGRAAEAFQNYNEALRLNPAHSQGYFYLGLEYLKSGMPDEARSSLNHAMRLSPGWDEPHLQVALILSGRGEIGGAVQQYREALRLKPENPVALNNLAWLRATQPEAEFRDGAEAVQLARKACDLTSNKEPVFLGTLAAAYAEAGQFDKAVESGRRACEVAGSLGQTNILRRNQELLLLYQAHKPCREGKG